MRSKYYDVPKIHSLEKLCNINSYMIALVLMAEFIAIVLSALFHLSDILPFIFVSAVTISYLTAFLGRYEFRININVLLLYLYSLLLFAISIFRNGTGTNTTYLINFLSYGFVGLLLLILPYNTKIILRVISCSALVYLFFPSKIVNFISIDTASYAIINMFSSYAISTIIIAAIVYLFFYTNSFKWYDVFIYLANLGLLLLLLLQGSRGAIIESFVIFLIIIWRKIGKSNTKLDFMKKYIFLVGILFIGYSVQTHFIQIIKLLYETLHSIGINISFINKSYTLISSQGSGVGVLNGRDTVFANALKLFSESPIIGAGVGGYGDAFKTWPHNLFLQLLSEMGVLFSIPFIYFLGKGIVSIFQQWTSDETRDAGIMLLFLFTISIPRLMLSSYFWKEQAFWMFIIATCTFIQYKRRNYLTGIGKV